MRMPAAMPSETRRKKKNRRRRRRRRHGNDDRGVVQTADLLPRIEGTVVVAVLKDQPTAALAGKVSPEWDAGRGVGGRGPHTGPDVGNRVLRVGSHAGQH